MPGESIPFRLVAGIGNPGAEYERTRHNAGFWYLDGLAARLGVSLKIDKRLQMAVGSVQVGDRKLYLCKPLNYMNNSGQGLSALIRFYKVPLEHVLIAHDELDLEPGTVRLKRGGGHGGHNGLRDTVSRLGGNGFWRLRIGIGHPGDSRRVSDYVLHRAPLLEQRLIDAAIDLALVQSEELLAGDIDVATRNLNSYRPAPS